MEEIIDCGLPLSIQKLYIKRLKHMIQRWEFENFCGHCPIHRHFKINVRRVKQFDGYGNFKRNICDFCGHNVKVVTGGCPCPNLGAKCALKRAKDFIERFEVQHENSI